MTRPIVPLLLAAALAGCATTYTDGSHPITGLAGGYFDVPGPAKLTTVGFAANGYTDPETVRRFVLRRACEVTQDQGMAHFLAFESLEHAAAMRPLGEDLGVHAVGGKPFQWIYILPLAAPQPGSLDAAAVLARVTVEPEK